MNSQWQSFLTHLGATIEHGMVEHFGDPDAELRAALEENTLCDLSHDGLIRALGADADTFLQGQLTNDIRTVDAANHQLSGYCSPKGRLLALFRLFRRDDAFYLQLPQELLEGMLKRLKMFVLMSKVELEDASDELVRFSLSGPDAESLLGRQLAGLPGDADHSVTENGISVLRVPGRLPRFILHGEPPAMQQLWRALSDEGARPVGAESGRLQQIHAGVPTVLQATQEAFVPQMVNLQLLNGVSFKKGCYTGQEVVARMQYLGKLKRRMYLTHAAGTTAPVVGGEIHSPSSASGQGAGKVVDVARSPQGGYDMLVVAEIACAEEDSLFLDDQHQEKLELLSLPYTLESRESTAQRAE